MLNIVINVCEKFHYDRLRNDRALGNGKIWQQQQEQQRS